MAIVEGVLTAIIVVAVNEFRSVPGDVRRHDHEIRVADDDYRTWVEDDDRKFRAEIGAVRAEIRVSGQEQDLKDELTRTGIVASARPLKDELLERERNRRRETERIRERIDLAERFRHRVWRWLARRPLPRLGGPEDIAAIVASWNSDEPVIG